MLILDRDEPGQSLNPEEMQIWAVSSLVANWPSPALAEFAAACRDWYDKNLPRYSHADGSIRQPPAKSALRIVKGASSPRRTEPQGAASERPETGA